MVRLQSSRAHHVQLLILLGVSWFFVGIIACNTPPEQQPETISQQEQPQQTPSEVDADKKRILIFGNSLTAGYGLDENQSFPSLLQNRLDSLGLDYQIVNGGLSGETSAGGASRIDWVLKQPVDIFILELGGNDMLRGLSLEETKRNLQKIIDAVAAKFPDIPIIVAGMQAAPNMGATYQQEFNEIYPEIAKQNGADLIPFLLDGVAGNVDLNLPDKIHPNAEGQKIVRDNVWQVLKKYLQE